MKNLKYILFLFTTLLFISCEEVVDVDLNTAPPRLVVEASIDWIRGTDGQQQTVKLSRTRGYYDNAIPTVSGATVTITSNAGTVFNFVEEAGTGKYVCNNFQPAINQTYVLTVIDNGQTYTATEKMYAAPIITRTAQTDAGGFLGEDIEMRFYWNDFPDEDNYYLSRIDANVLPFPEYDVNNDEFFRGNEMFELFFDEDLVAGDSIDIKLFGISQQYHDYMNVLLEAAGGGGNPFSAVPVAARGNVINQTNNANYALGYFRVCEVGSLTYIVQ